MSVNHYSDSRFISFIMEVLIDKVKRMSARLAFIIYGGTAVTLLLLWLLLPQYTWGHAWDGWCNGLSVTYHLSYYNSIIAFLFLSNAMLPGVALLMTFLNKTCNWLFPLITLGYAFTTGLVGMVSSHFGVSVLWFFVLGIYAIWCAFAYFRRGLPATL